MIMLRRAAPFIYVVIGIIGDALFSERVSSVIWVVGALLLAAMYSLGLGRRKPAADSPRAAERAARRSR